MSDPRWHDADSSNSRDGRPPGTPDRYAGAPDGRGRGRREPDYRPGDPRSSGQGSGGRWAGGQGSGGRGSGGGQSGGQRSGGGWDDLAQTRQIQAAPDLGGRGDNGAASRAGAGGRDRGGSGGRSRGGSESGSRVAGGAAGGVVTGGRGTRSGARGAGRGRAGGGPGGRARTGRSGASGGRRASTGPTRLTLGHMSGGIGIAIVAGSAIVGGVATLALNSDPGTVLGVCVVIGTLAAGLAVRPRAAYLLLPVPALCYTVVALVTGRIHDPTNTSHIDQLIHAGTWVANGFVSMVAATIVAIVVFGIRLFLDWWMNSSGPRRSGGGPRRPAPSPPPRPDFGQTGPMPRYGATEAGYGTGSQPGYGASGAPGGYGTSPGPSQATGTGPMHGGTGPMHSGNGTGPTYTGNGSGPGHGNSGANPAQGGTGPTFRPAPPGPYGANGTQRPPLPDPYRPELPPGRQR